MKRLEAKSSTALHTISLGIPGEKSQSWHDLDFHIVKSAQSQNSIFTAHQRPSTDSWRQDNLCTVLVEEKPTIECSLLPDWKISPSTLAFTSFKSLPRLVPLTVSLTLCIKFCALWTNISVACSASASFSWDGFPRVVAFTVDKMRSCVLMVGRRSKVYQRKCN